MIGKWRIAPAPVVSDLDALAAMDEFKLCDYFIENARFDPRNKTNPYWIFFGDRSIKAADLDVLGNMFRGAVARHRETN